MYEHGRQCAIMHHEVDDDVSCGNAYAHDFDDDLIMLLTVMVVLNVCAVMLIILILTTTMMCLM